MRHGVAATIPVARQELGPLTPTESDMPHQDPTFPTGPRPHHQDLKRVLDWLTDPADFAGVRFRATCTWDPRGLTCAALLWAWSDQAALTERFAAARQVAVAALGLGTATATTYQAFLKMLR